MERYTEQKSVCIHILTGRAARQSLGGRMKKYRAALAVCVTAALVVAGCGGKPEPAGVARPPKPTALVDAARIAAPADGEWLTYGRTYDEQRFSPLTQINAANVGKLGLAWCADLDTASRAGGDAAGRRRRALRHHRLEHGLRLRRARPARSCGRYDPKVPGEKGVYACCDVVNRGVAAWNGKIYRRHARRPADRARRRDRQAGVGQSDHPDRISPTPSPARRACSTARCSSATAAPSSACAATSRAYDAETGKQLWRFYTVPGDPVEGRSRTPALEMAAKTWTGEWWKLGGGGTVWDSIVYDPKLNLVYIGTGNGSPWNQKLRSPGGGDNLFLSSIVALKARHRRIRLALPDDARRDLGLHRHAAHDAGRPEDRRQAAPGAHAGAEERLLLRARPRDRRADLGERLRAR